jgi:hypothetical protein
VRRAYAGRGGRGQNVKPLKGKRQVVRKVAHQGGDEAGAVAQAEREELRVRREIPLVHLRTKLKRSGTSRTTRAPTHAPRGEQLYTTAPRGEGRKEL